MLLSEPFGLTFKAPALPNGFRSGYLVVRPEALRFVAKASDADNVIPGKLYNEYALGSRVQYQVRSGDHVLIVERLRQQSGPLQRDADVSVGWDATDSVLVGD